MKNKKRKLGTIFTIIIVVIILTAVFVRSMSGIKGKSEIDTDVDTSLINEPSKNEPIKNEVVSENPLETKNELPNYYHSVSDADESFVYLGGAGGIYRIASGSETKKLYSSPQIAGTALYRDYIFSIEYNMSDEDLVAELIKINKISYEKEVLVQISPSSYDLKIFGDTLILSETVLENYGMKTIYQAYTLNEEGNLMADMPENVCEQFESKDGYGQDIRFLINPWFSMKYFNYICFTEIAEAESLNNVWIKKKDQASAEKIVICNSDPLLAKDKIFYYNHDEKVLALLIFDNLQAILLYDIPEGNHLSLLTYDTDWVYFLQMPDTDADSDSSQVIMRVNIQNHKTEEIFRLQTGASISNFNVYGNYCYFILSNADKSGGWKCYDLTNSVMTAIH